MKKSESSSSRKRIPAREDLHQIISERAYFLAVAENFAPGREEAHWLQAEAEIMLELSPPGKAVVNAVTRPAAKRTAKPGAKTGSAGKKKSAR